MSTRREDPMRLWVGEWMPEGMERPAERSRQAPRPKGATAKKDKTSRQAVDGRVHAHTR
jgi:hypothetical protein